ncbi:MAG: hypothetical protein JW828_08810 [Sedimentisphaerales bacterium]|nr:hypothetical protein [Sedimentisphaerales bacterium]
MRIGLATRYTALSFLTLFTALLTYAAPPEPIYLFDLRYAMRFNADDTSQAKMAWDHCHAVAALQGLVNRDAPRLYLLAIDSQHQRGQSVDQYWLDYLQAEDNWLHNRSTKTIQSVEDLIKTFRPYIQGVVVYDPKVAATSNVASTIAGTDHLLPVRYDTALDSLYSKLVLNGPKLPIKIWLLKPNGTSLFTGKGMIPGTNRKSVGSAKCDAYLWLKYHYMDTGKCSGSIGAYYLDQYWIDKPRLAPLNHHCLTNHDYFVANRAFFFDLGVWGDEVPVDDPQQTLGTDLETLKELLLSAYHHGGRENMIHIGGFVPWAHKYTTHGAAGGTHDPVPSEWEYGKVISAYNGYMDADAIGYGAMANASFYMHFPLQKRYPQKWTTRAELMAKGYLTSDDKVDFKGREFIIFYVGDYDCAAWLYQRTMDVWDDPNRGKVPMMWAIGPHLARRAPMAMHFMRTTATPNDYFVAADNGSGYCEPGMLQEPRGISGLPCGLDAWARHCRRDYVRWGLTVTGFIIYGHGPELNQAGLDCYASFSPNGIVPTGGFAELLHGNMPVLRFDHDIMESNPADAARHILLRMEFRRQNGHPPFHWFRNILKTPTWYVQVNEELKKQNPNVELLDAPAFFELYRIFLQNHPEFAKGKP